MDHMSRRAVPSAKRAPSPSLPIAAAPSPRSRPTETLWQAKKPWIVAGIILLVFLIGLMSWRLYATSTSSLIKNDRYQAVFLTNGQVYFGKLSKVNDQHFRLTDIYYLESNNDLTGTKSESAAKNNQSATPQLLKFGKEIHGPENEMIISEKQILFFENITSDGTVGKAIANDKARQRQ